RRQRQRLRPRLRHIDGRARTHRRVSLSADLSASRRACRKTLATGATPADGPAIAVGHEAVELPRIVVEDERQEIAVAFPQGEIKKSIQLHPFQRAFRVFRPWRAVPAIDAEDEAEPVFAVLAETRPINRAAQNQFLAFKSGFLADFAANARDYILF